MTLLRCDLPWALSLGVEQWLLPKPAMPLPSELILQLGGAPLSQHVTVSTSPLMLLNGP